MLLFVVLATAAVLTLVIALGRGASALSQADAEPTRTTCGAR